MRSLLPRILVAIIGIPLLLLLARSGPWARALLILLLQGLILREWAKMSAARGLRMSIIGTVISVAGLDGFVMLSHPAMLACGILAVAIMLLIEVFRRDRRPLANLGASGLYLVYVGLPLALWFVLDQPNNAEHFAPAGALIALWLSTWLCDSAAYFTGMAIGKHKLFPAASPNKTIEGFAGGVIGAVAAPLFMALCGWIQASLVSMLVLGGIVGFVGQTGDLLESLMKRETQIKDTSSLLPGHGGLLDRFDSLLLSTPFFYAYLLLSSL
jgi:phosphatidate cytidylyltransferase